MTDINDIWSDDDDQRLADEKMNWRDRRLAEMAKNQREREIKEKDHPHD